MSQKGLNVLSLCDGQSCGQIALKELNIKVSQYYASEIDKFAIDQTQLNFPKTIQLGDMSDWKEWDIDFSKIDLILAGTPCQGFSFAGKMLAFDDPRSRLFFVFVDILNHVRSFNKDVKFLLENVNMRKSDMAVINEHLGVSPVRINSNLVSAQNRDRFYWSNIRTSEVGLFGDIHTDIPLPKDRGIYLKDILEQEVDEKYYLSDKMIECFVNRPDGWANDFKPFSNLKSKARCLGTRQYQQGNNYLIDDKLHIPEATKKGYTEINIGECFDMEHPKSTTRRGRKMDKKSNCLMAKTPDFMRYEGVNDVIQLNNSTESGGKQPYQQNRVYADYGKSPCLDTDSGRKSVYTNYRIRRLTPTECARLQTIPSWYKWDCSDTQQYKMLGNGWTIEVIKHILGYLISPLNHSN